MPGTSSEAALPGLESSNGWTVLRPEGPLVLWAEPSLRLQGRIKPFNHQS